MSRILPKHKPKSYTKFISNLNYGVRLRVPNTSEGLQAIADLKKDVRGQMKVTVRGRCKNRKQVFFNTGREYSNRADCNDVHLNTPQAPYCYEWAVYVRVVYKDTKII